MVNGAGLVSVPKMSDADLCYRWDDFPPNAQAASGLVSSDVVCNEPEAWSKCSWAAKGSWSWLLQNGVDVAAQAAACHGATRKGSSDWVS